MPTFTPPGLPVIPPVSVADTKNGPPTEQSNPQGYRLMRYFYASGSSFQRSRGVNVWKMTDGTYQMSDPVPGVNFLGLTAWPYPDTDNPVNNAISSSWYSGGAAPLGVNLLSAQDSSLESAGNGTWTATTGNTTVSTSSGVAYVGNMALLLLAEAAGDVGAVTASNVYAVTPGVAYSATAFMLGFPVARPAFATIGWYTAGGVGITNSTGTPTLVGLYNGVSAPQSAWRQIAVTGTAPANAAFAAVGLGVPNCGPPVGLQVENYYADNIQLQTGGNTTGGSGPGGDIQKVSPGIAIEYLGGRSYAVSSSEAANLNAVGLGAYVV